MISCRNRLALSFGAIYTDDPYDISFRGVLYREEYELNTDTEDSIFNSEPRHSVADITATEGWRLEDGARAGQ